MGQAIAVAVKEFTVTQSITSNSITEVPVKFKPKAVTALQNVQVDPPKGKTLHPYSVDITVVIKKVDAVVAGKKVKAVRAEVNITLNDQDPYSKKDKAIRTVSGGGTVPTDNPDKGDIEFAIENALKEAIKTTITGIQDHAKQP